MYICTLKCYQFIIRTQQQANPLLNIRWNKLSTPASSALERTKKTRAKRDPKGRKQAIADAAAQVLVEFGPRAMTFRQVAAVADVPLGSVTQYFSESASLREAAVEVLSERFLKDSREMVACVEEAGGDVMALGDLLIQYAANTDMAQVDNAIYSAAYTEPILRPAVVSAYEELVRGLSRFVPEHNARALVTFLDGAFAYIGLYGKPIDENLVRSSIEALVAMPCK